MRPIIPFNTSSTDPPIPSGLRRNHIVYTSTTTTKEPLL